MSKSKYTILGMVVGLAGGFLGAIFLVPVEFKLFLGMNLKDVGGLEGLIFSPALIILFSLTWIIIFSVATLIGLYLDKLKLTEGAE